jgi:hypothetical protein
LALEERGLDLVRELLDRVDEPALRRALAADALSALPEMNKDELQQWIVEESKRTLLGESAQDRFDQWSAAVSRALVARTVRLGHVGRKPGE